MDKDNLVLAVSILAGLLIFFGFIGSMVYMDYASNQNGMTTCVDAGGSWSRGTCILDKSK